MGSMIASGLGAVATKLVTAYTAPKLLKYTLEAGAKYGGAQSNQLTADLQNIVTKYGAMMPSSAEVTGYQNAVCDMATIAKGIKADKQAFDLFKTAAGQLAINRSTQITPAMRGIIAARVAAAMRCSVATVKTDFDMRSTPIEHFLNKLTTGSPPQTQDKIIKNYAALVYPLAFAGAICVILS